jgi:UDP-N-acetylmuramoyl-tripeptide--D-alanyl-D-alanine ligase
VRELAGGITLLDDSYNSNPRALEVMLRVVGEVHGRRKVGVLGEMLELGTTARARHEECGRQAARALDRLIAVGGDAARALADAAAASMPAGSVAWVPSSAEAADRILAFVIPGDVVLVKGSRGTRTEVVVEKLIASMSGPRGPEQ